MSNKQYSGGFSLIEAVVFILVLGIGLAGMLILYNQATRASVDPLVRKQALAIATSLLEEIELRGFTYCDPDDANVYTASSSALGPNGCAASAESIGPEPGESTRAVFDNVNDYHGLQMLSGIRDITGAAVAGLDAYKVTSVSVSAAGAAFALPDPNDALLISLTVTGPTDVTITLHGYRFRYAPNTP